MDLLLQMSKLQLALYYGSAYNGKTDLKTGVLAIHMDPAAKGT